MTKVIRCPKCLGVKVRVDGEIIKGDTKWYPREMYSTIIKKFALGVLSILTTPTRLLRLEKDQQEGAGNHQEELPDGFTRHLSYLLRKGDGR